MFFKNFSENYYDKLFRGLSLLTIGGVLFLDIFPSWFSVFESFFNSSLFKDDNLVELADHAVTVHANFLTLGFLLTTFLVFKNKIRLINFGVILFASWALGIYELMDHYIHPLFLNMGFFSHFMRPGIPDLNPQYTRLFLFLLSNLVLFILCIRGKTRTIDRSFVFLISSSMIITTFLFHLVIPMGILKYAKEDRLNTYVENMIELPSEFFCKDKTCIFFNKKFEEKTENFIGNRDLAKNFNGFINYSRSFFSNKENLVFPVYGNAGDFVGASSTFHSCIYRNDEFMCSFDNKSMRNYGILSQVLFSFLTSIAHGVWIFGGLLLLSMHKNRTVKKLAYQVRKNN